MSFGVQGSGGEIPRAEMSIATTSKQGESAHSEPGIELSEMVTSKDPNSLQAADAEAKGRVEGNLTPLQKLAPGLNLNQVALGKEAKRSDGGASGVFFIERGDVSIVIKPPDNINTDAVYCYVGTKALELLGVKVPESVLVKGTGEVADLQRITGRSVGAFVAMEKVHGTAFNVLMEEDEERVLSKSGDYFHQLGRMVMFDHLLSDEPDRVKRNGANPQNLMLGENHIVAIDNGTDLLNENAATGGLRAFKNEGFLDELFPKTMYLVSIPEEDRPIFREQFEKGLVEGIAILLDRLTESDGKEAKVSEEKIRKFLHDAGVPEEHMARATRNLTERMNVVIELSSDKRYYQKVKEAKASGCCTIL